MTNAPSIPWRPEVVFGFADERAQAQTLAAKLNAAYAEIEVHQFPDQELKVRVPVQAACAVIYRLLHHPNAKLIEVLLAAGALRDMGCRDIALIAPYLPYMRQDIAFQPGEAVSQRIIGGMLTQAFDRFVAVDPHLHRTPTLEAVFGGKPALALSGAAAIAKHMAAADLGNTLVLGPDEESAPLVRRIAEPLRLDWTTGLKQRFGDHDVRITLPESVGWTKRPVVIADDVISSGGTAVALVNLLRERGAGPIDVYATHALFGDTVHDALLEAGVRRIVSCDGIPHRTNAMSVVDVIVEGVAAWRSR